MKILFDPGKLTKRQRYYVKRQRHCSPEDYARAFAEQAGKCACCGNESKRHFRADRMRRDGKLSLLCINCFNLLERLFLRGQAFIEYIESAQLRN